MTITLVVVYCDQCGTEHRADHSGATKTERISSARRHLAATGWVITTSTDLCPSCARQLHGDTA